MFVLYTNGNLYFRGRNTYSVSGVATLGEPVSSMTLVNTDVLDIEVASTNNSYFVRSQAMIIKEVAGQRKVYTAGYNLSGACGNGTTSQVSTWHDATPPGKQVSAIYCLGMLNANGHNAIITTDNEVWCCGSNAVGQLGDGTTTDRTYFTKMNLPSGEIPVQLQLSFHSDSNSGNTFILTESGNIYATGSDGLHHFATGVAGDKSTPFLMYDGVTSGVKATYILSNIQGPTYLLYLDELGNVYGVGANSRYQLGDGTGTHRDTWVRTVLPQDVNGSSRVVSLKQIQTRDNVQYNTGMVITSDNKMLTWGFNSRGSVGDGTYTDRPSPVDITSQVNTLIGSTDNITSIWAASQPYDMTWYVQVRESPTNPHGSVYGWGDNRKKLLANTSSTYYASPVVVHNT